MKRKKSEQSKHYNWLMGADMYLASSVILCDTMLESYPSTIQCLNPDQQIDKKCGFTSCNPDYEMLMPVVFNLKHGIELYLKALIMQVNVNLEYPQSHDLIVLLNTLILDIKNKKNDHHTLKVLDTDLRKSIEKYYFGLYAFASERVQPDIYNEAERYPEYKNTNCYKVKKLEDIDMCNLLNQIKKDCRLVQKWFREDVLKQLSSLFEIQNYQ